MTEATKHTPGPWETGGIMTRVEMRPDGWNVPMCIADCHAKYSPESGAERVANARLIAAAPELLAALHLIVECADADNPPDLVDHRPITYHIDGAWIDRARAAIAKATGRRE